MLVLGACVDAWAVPGLRFLLRVTHVLVRMLAGVEIVCIASGNLHLQQLPGHGKQELKHELHNVLGHDH